MRILLGLALLGSVSLLVANPAPAEKLNLCSIEVACDVCAIQVLCQPVPPCVVVCPPTILIEPGAPIQNVATGAGTPTLGSAGMVHLEFLGDPDLSATVLSISVPAEDPQCGVWHNLAAVVSECHDNDLLVDDVALYAVDQNSGSGLCLREATYGVDVDDDGHADFTTPGVWLSSSPC